MSLSNTSLSKPKLWQDFEASMTVLMTCALDDPATQPNGRTGQPQAGVDIYGHRNRDLARLVGLQCKQKLYAKVTEKELRGEVIKAKTFQPKLAEFILATTAPRDQAIQTVARKITQELAATNHPMTVAVWGWEDIEEQASKYDDAYNAFDPTFNPFAKRAYEKLDASIQQAVTQICSKLQTAAPPQADFTADAGSENTPLHGQITAYISLINEGHVQAAITQLEKLRASNWANASRSERYRLLVAIGAAKLKEDDFPAAGRLLLDAFAECPEHKKAKQNRAKGYLLVGDYTRAEHIALEILNECSENSDAACTLIQARAHNSRCRSPVDDIPEALLGTEDVLIAQTFFLRHRDDPAWILLARQSAEKHPSCRYLRMMAAEAVLDVLILGDRDVIAGAPVKAVTQAQMEVAVAALKEDALDAIEKGYKIPASLANNAALALRFVDDIPTATRILDTAVLQHPDDENLRLQSAILAYSQNNMRRVLELVHENTSNPESVPMRATALAHTGRPDDALKLIDGFDTTDAPSHVRLGILSARCHAYLARNEKQLAIEAARRDVLATPGDVSVAAVLIRTYDLAGDTNAASAALEEAAAHIHEATDMPSRLLLSIEAQRLNRNDIIVKLLNGRVSMNYETEALHLLVTAAINGHFWVTAQETLDSLPEHLRDQEWVHRARTILAINTGNRDAEQRVGAYLGRWPNDASMILARIRAWQRTGRDKDIARLVSSINFDALEGSAETRIRLAAMACHYGDAARGLEYAYSVLMANWDNPKAHLSYQGLILLNEHIGPVLPPSNAVAENTVVYLTGADGERRYRLEKRSHKFFADERLALDADLARLLMGKKVGESVLLQDHIGARPVTVAAITPIYTDALHRSMNQFNERFPRAKGLMKLSFDATAADPLEEMRSITKARAEFQHEVLESYRSKPVALAFIAGVIGHDAIGAWTGLSPADIRFRVCHGDHQERASALRRLADRERKGCVLDAITLSIIRRLSVQDAVISICGPLYAPQSVLDLLLSRALEAKKNVGKKMGFMSWQGGQLGLMEYTAEMLKDTAAQNEAERAWAAANVSVATAMPKRDFSPQIQNFIGQVGHLATDPAVAADGSGLLLLSDDMGLRLWSEAALGITATWLQPVLMQARREGKISEERYFDAINMMVLNGHTYISLEPGALIHQARKSGFDVSDEVRRLLAVVGGPTADLHSNCRVIAEFLDILKKDCPDDFKVMRIASQSFASMVRGRVEAQRQIVGQILRHVTSDPRWLRDHALAWLVGHSIGASEFDKLLAIQRGD